MPRPKEPQDDMHVPAEREHVHIKGREEIYFVLAVDRELGNVYVIDLGGSRNVETVNFEELVPIEQSSAGGS